MLRPQTSLPPENLARAGVSVVRIISFYKPSTNVSTQSIVCTGLGIIVESGTSTGPTDQNNWVLTSGSLVNPTEADCTTGTPKATLTTITILMSSAYNPHIVTYSTSTLFGTTVICQQAHACGTGFALFSFQSTQTLPYADLAAIPATQADTIELTQNSTSQALPPASITGTTTSYQQSVTSYTTPVIATGGVVEAGAPLVYTTGTITGLHLSSKSTPAIVTTIQSFINGQNTLANFFKDHHNLVHDNWNNGMTILYQKSPDTQAANADFTQTFQDNQQFVGAQQFAQLANSPTTSSSGGSKTPPASNTTSSSPTKGNTFSGTLLPIIIIVIIVLLALIFLIMFLVRRSAHQHRFEHEMAEAHVIARDQLAKKPHEPIRPVGSQAETVVPCPNCGSLIPAQARYCPRCRFPILSEVEEHVQGDIGSPPRRVISNAPQSASAPPAKVDENVQLLSAAEAKSGALQQVGKYCLLELLGSGGFADVYVGEHIYLKKRVAVKVLRIHLSEKLLDSFLAEARIIAGLSHPHIVQVHDFDIFNASGALLQNAVLAQGGIPFLVMDYAPGGTVSRRHLRGSHVPLERVVQYTQQMADALMYAHRQNIVHRDVKPANMLIGAQGEVLLGDFGLATVVRQTQTLSTQAVAGTARYMAPEQFRGKARPASDQYALAVCVYQWLCGELPFSGDDFIQLAFQHTNEPVPPLSERAPEVPERVAAVVMRALSKDPEARFDTIQTFANALRDAARL